jgi:hypothetical protein
LNLNLICTASPNVVGIVDIRKSDSLFDFILYARPEPALAISSAPITFIRETIADENVLYGLVIYVVKHAVNSKTHLIHHKMAQYNIGAVFYASESIGLRFNY